MAVTEAFAPIETSPVTNKRLFKEASWATNKRPPMDTSDATYKRLFIETSFVK